MDTKLQINDNFFDFIADNSGKDSNQLRLKYGNSSSNYDFDIKLAILQIECRAKARKKIPELLANPRFIFPMAISAEQCTSEVIARFHATLFNGYRSILDMSAGLCVDSYYISTLNDATLISTDIDETVAMIGAYNMQILGAKVAVVNCNSVDYINNCNQQFDAIFIDPARRGNNNSRIFSLVDCAPNIVPLLPRISQLTNRLIVKASPMIDLSSTLNLIPNITDIWIVGFKNECREMLFSVNLSAEFRTENITIHTVNFESESHLQEFNYTRQLPNTVNRNILKTDIPEVGIYMYEPNCCIMKAGSFTELSEQYPQLSKLHNNTHIFLSDKLIEDFPGRKFRIKEIIPFKDKLIRKLSREDNQANVVTRNFPLTAEQLKSKLKIKDGGERYIYGVTLSDNSKVLIEVERL
ncbi:MAG: class I SAM-dependent methyltransferase [Bacteroidales bacterium]